MANATDALVDALIHADADAAAVSVIPWSTGALNGMLSNGKDPLDMLQADTHTAGVLAFLYVSSNSATRLASGQVSALERISIALGAAHTNQLCAAPAVVDCLARALAEHGVPADASAVALLEELFRHVTAAYRGISNVHAKLLTVRCC